MTGAAFRCRWHVIGGFTRSGRPIVTARARALHLRVIDVDRRPRRIQMTRLASVG